MTIGLHGKCVEAWKGAHESWRFKEKTVENSWENCRKSGRVGDDAVSRKLLSIRRRVENEADEKGKCGTVGRKRMQKQ